MGGVDRFARTIPRAQSGEAAPYQFAPLSGATRPASRNMDPGTQAQRETSGYEAGLAQGRAEAARAAQAQRASDKARIDAVVERLQSAMDEGIAGAADQVLELAFSIARQVLRDEITARREAVLPVVRETLALLAEGHGHPVVRLAPADHAALRETLEGEHQHRGVRFVADPGVAPGGCRVETPQVEIDASVATRWARVLASLGSESPAPETRLDPES